MRRPEDRAAAATAAGAAVVLASLAALHLLGDGALAAPPLRSTSALRAWAAERGPVAAGIAVFRLVALGIAYHLVVTTALGVAGRALRWQGLSRLAEAATVPPLRGAVRRLAGIGLSASAVLVTPVPAASGQVPASTGQAPVDGVPGAGATLTRLRSPGPERAPWSRAAFDRRAASPLLAPGTATMDRRPLSASTASDRGAAAAERSGGTTMRRTEPSPAVMTRRAGPPPPPAGAEDGGEAPTTPASPVPAAPGGPATGEATAEATDEATDEATGELAVDVSDEAAGDVADGAADQAADAPVDGATDAPPPTRRHRVRPGDHLWAIAEQRLATHLGRAPTDAETTVHWRAVVADNPQLVDPDLLFPGDEIDLPPLPQTATASLDQRPSPHP